MTPYAAVAHFHAQLPANPDNDSPADTADREAHATLAAAVAALEQLRADIATAAEWLREPGVSGAEVWPWLLARTGLEMKDPE